MSDNATAHRADEYEAEVARTIPFHAEILETAVDVVLAARGEVSRWLDTGCGPGKLGALARSRSPRSEFWLADPSEAMLSIARERHADLPAGRFIGKPSQELPQLEPFDAITAVLCHHYCDVDARLRALVRCRELLAPSGAFVTFENVRAETDAGRAIARTRWREFQRRAGRDDATIEKMVAREGTAFFPIRVSEHLALFARAGFTKVEIVWRAYGQAGFYCQ